MAFLNLFGKKKRKTIKRKYTRKPKRKYTRRTKYTGPTGYINYNNTNTTAPDDVQMEEQSDWTKPESKSSFVPYGLSLPVPKSKSSIIPSYTSEPMSDGYSDDINEAMVNLGGTSATTPSEFRKMYLRRVMSEHPDKGGDAEVFKRTDASYRLLKEKGLAAFGKSRRKIDSDIAYLKSLR